MWFHWLDTDSKTSVPSLELESAWSYMMCPSTDSSHSKGGTCMVAMRCAESSDSIWYNRFGSIFKSTNHFFSCPIASYYNRYHCDTSMNRCNRRSLVCSLIFCISLLEDCVMWAVCIVVWVESPGLLSSFVEAGGECRPGTIWLCLGLYLWGSLSIFCGGYQPFSPHQNWGRFTSNVSPW